MGLARVYGMWEAARQTEPFCVRVAVRWAFVAARLLDLYVLLGQGILAGSGKPQEVSRVIINPLLCSDKRTKTSVSTISPIPPITTTSFAPLKGEFKIIINKAATSAPIEGGLRNHILDTDEVVHRI